MEEADVAGFQFFANFDSGNLARVEVEEDETASSMTGVESALELTAKKGSSPSTHDFAFKLWTSPDCAGTEFQNGNRTWFYFGLKGGPPSPKLLKLSVMNLNKQSKLFSQGMVPIVARVPKHHQAKKKPRRWERLKEDRPAFRVNQEDNNFVLTFRVRSDPKCVTYVAFTFPYSYHELQSQLGRLERRHGCGGRSYDELAGAFSVYFHRENACLSNQGRRVDLLTISGTNGISDERESGLANMFDDGALRPFKFPDKKVVFVSARVHPGETQSSFVVNGFLKFLLRPSDPRAAELRRRYVFKIMPMLNPDGVYNGHYRTDMRGVNLNRVYADPSFELYPSIYAARSLLLYAHRGSVDKADGDDVCSEERETSSSSAAAAAADPSSWLKSTAMDVSSNWYEMTETSRCSEGDESIADFSFLHPKASSSSSHSQKADRNNISFAGALSSKWLPPPPPPPPLIPPHAAVAAPEEAERLEKPVVESMLDEENANMEFAASEKSPSNKQTASSGLFLYVDVHGHASKRGIFMYGNHFADIHTKVASMLLPKLMSVNCANFDFPACNFTEKNMYLKDRHTGAGREGSGRVSAYKVTGLVQSYTLECNFNSGRVFNSVPSDCGRATPPPHLGPPTKGSSDGGGGVSIGAAPIPKYNRETYEDAGKQMAVSILDLTESNPWTRLASSPYKNLKGVREWIRKYIKHSEEQQRSKSSPGKGTKPSGASSLPSGLSPPARSLRSTSRRVRTYSSGSSGHTASSRTGRSKKKTAHGGPGSPGSYRPVSKIARKSSLNQQQSPPSHQHIRLRQPPAEATGGPSAKACRSKSLIVGVQVKAGAKKKRAGVQRSTSLVLNRRSSPPTPKVPKAKARPPKVRKASQCGAADPGPSGREAAKATSSSSSKGQKKKAGKKAKGQQAASVLPVDVDHQVPDVSFGGSSSAAKKHMKPKRG